MRTRIVATILTITWFAIANAGLAQSIDMSKVTAIEINIACNLTIVQGTNPSIKIEGDDEDIAHIKINTQNQKLTVKSNKKNQHKDGVLVKIEVNSLEYLTIGGAVNIEPTSMLNFENFTLSISGVASGEINVTGHNLDLDCSGVCNLDFAGKYSVLDINVSGVGNINTSKLAARRVNVKNSGVGRVTVLAIDYLNASVSGVGSIRYAGNPKISTSVSGLGRIRKL